MFNVEIKATYHNFEYARNIIDQKGGLYRGIDHQVDTYFTSRQGRLKLREGNIENNLIFYNRADKEGPKVSEINLHPVEQPGSLKSVLRAAVGVDIIVDKEREIYFIDNIKIHLDKVIGLGKFLEIEAIDEDETIGKNRLEKQCTDLMVAFEITGSMLIAQSYSDLLSPKPD